MNDYMIDYKHNNAVIKGHSIPLTMTHGIANTIPMWLMSALNIPGWIVHLVDVSLLSEWRQGDRAFLQTIKISVAAITIYKGTKVGNITPLLTVESTEHSYLASICSICTLNRL